jgi:hypothetical protein
MSDGIRDLRSFNFLMVLSARSMAELTASSMPFFDVPLLDARKIMSRRSRALPNKR